MVTASQRLQNTWKVLAGTDTLLTHPSRGDAQSRASILQAFLRTDQDVSLRPWGRRCLADHHLRTWCPPNKPPRVRACLEDRKSTRLNSSHDQISYAVFCLKKKKTARSALPALPASTT